MNNTRKYKAAIINKFTKKVNDYLNPEKKKSKFGH